MGDRGWVFVTLTALNNMWDLGRWLGATFPLPVKLLSGEGEVVDERVAKRRGAENKRRW